MGALSQPPEPPMSGKDGMILTMSICTYNNGAFDVIFRDRKTGEEFTFSGHQKVGKEDFDFIGRIAPACVWTDYQRITPDDEEG